MNDDGRLILSHQVTGENIALDAGVAWQLFFDDQGYAFVYDGGVCDPDLVPVDELLKFNLSLAADGRRLLICNARTNLGGCRSWLGELKSRFSETSCSVAVGATRRPLKVSMYALTYPRKSAKLFVALKDLYAGMHLSQFGGRSWMWIYGSQKRWRQSFQEYGIADHMIASAASSKGATGDDDDDEAFLPAHSIIFQGLVVRLGRWAWSTARRGGFQDAEHRQAALDILLGLLRVVFPAAGGASLSWKAGMVRD